MSQLAVYKGFTRSTDFEQWLPGRRFSKSEAKRLALRGWEGELDDDNDDPEDEILACLRETRQRAPVPR